MTGCLLAMAAIHRWMTLDVRKTTKISWYGLTR
jgi:hypothetical protein